MQVTTEKLKKYFLGNLSNEESEDISLQIISDASFEDQLRIAESDLMEDLLEENLTDEEQKLFYTNFLVSEDRKEALKELSLLKAYAKDAVWTEVVIKKAEKDSAPGLWATLKSVFTANPRSAAAVFALITILLLTGLVWRIFIYDSFPQLTPLEKEYSQLNQRDLDNSSEYGSYTNVNLFSGTLRGGGKANGLKLQSLTKDVFFHLALPYEIPENTLLKAALIEDQKTKFSLDKIRIYKNQNGQEIKLILPRSVLSRGQYQIKIESPNPSDLPIIYGFAVE